MQSCSFLPFVRGSDDLAVMPDKSLNAFSLNMNEACISLKSISVCHCLCRAQWSRQDVNERSIREYWGAINDRVWATEDCLDRLASSAIGQKKLLLSGLEETQRHLQSTHNSGTVTPQDWLASACTLGCLATQATSLV